MDPPGFRPSALLLGVTQHLATDVVSAPLLWVIPLALYLMTFIAAFSSSDHGSARWWGSDRACGRAARPRPLARGGALSDPADHVRASHHVHGAGDAVPHATCREPSGSRAPDRLLRVRLARRCAWRRGRRACRARRVLVDPRYPLAIAAAVFLRPQTIQADHSAKSPAASLDVARDRGDIVRRRILGHLDLQRARRRGPDATARAGVARRFRRFCCGSRGSRAALCRRRQQAYSLAPVS